jgi:hypothetical protein
VIDVQDAIPDVASEPLQATPTAWLNQPFWSGARVDTAATLVGAAESYLSGKDFELTFPALSVHVPLGAALPLSGPL